MLRMTQLCRSSSAFHRRPHTVMLDRGVHIGQACSPFTRQRFPFCRCPPPVIDLSVSGKASILRAGSVLFLFPFLSMPSPCNWSPQSVEKQVFSKAGSSTALRRRPSTYAKVGGAIYFSIRGPLTQPIQDCRLILGAIYAKV